MGVGADVSAGAGSGEGVVVGAALGDARMMVDEAVLVTVGGIRVASGVAHDESPSANVTYRASKDAMRIGRERTERKPTPDMAIPLYLQADFNLHSL